jgi:hypothetical protein
LAVGFSDLGSGGAEDMNGCRARMDGGDKSDSCNGKVACGQNGESEMTMCASALDRGDRHRIGIELLLERFETCVSWFVFGGQGT